MFSRPFLCFYGDSYDYIKFGLHSTDTSFSLIMTCSEARNRMCNVLTWP